MDNNIPQNPEFSESPTPQPTPQPMAQPYAQPTPQPMAQPYAQPSPQPMTQSYAPQSAPQPMAQPYMPQQASQPYAQPTQQPMSAPVKQPMDPSKKKKIITWIIIGCSILVLGIAAAIVIPIILRIDYSEAYKLSSGLKDNINELYWNFDCEDVVNYYGSEYTTDKTYTKYVESCKTTLSVIKDDITKLGETDGVKRDNSIQEKFNAFKGLYDSMVSDSDQINTYLGYYSTWHQFIASKEGLTASNATDAQITTSANILINSNSEELKKYGEGWLEKALNFAKATREFNNRPSGGSLDTYYALRDARDDASTKQKQYVLENEPDLESLYPLNFENTSKILEAYNDMHRLIAETYQNNYNKGSNDCSEYEFLNEVYCD